MPLTDIIKIAKSLVTLADDLQRYHAEIKEIRREVRDLTFIVHALVQENKHNKENAENERRILVLELEKKILEFERRLPAAPEEEIKKKGKK